MVCEKPLALNPWNVTALGEIEKETGGKINTILQLRLHPSIIELKERIDNSPEGTVHDVDLTYITSRGHWYLVSWKGDVSKSGGIANNIGVHFFDMLTWIFGSVKTNTVNVYEPRRSAGVLELEKANVRWFLSLEENDLPAKPKDSGARTYRAIQVDGQEVEFSDGCTDLHTKSYERILAGDGFGTDAVTESVRIVSQIRNAEVVGLKGEYHPMANASHRS